MDTVLLSAAVALGLLSVYEPCSIATHTLFAARAHASPRGERRRALAELVVARCALLAALFGAAAAFGPLRPPALAAATVLVAIGAIYLVARTRYLPVPHVEVFHLLPAQACLSAGAKIGLTLPACTLPLVAITGALAAAIGRPGLAAIAGVLFGTAFAAPTLYHAAVGFAPVRRTFLAHAAAVTPWLTAGLIWGGAAWVWQSGG